MSMLFDLADPSVAYLLGLLHTDGSHYGGVDSKGKVTIELAVRDIEVLRGLQAVIPCYSSITTRTRSTNFADNYTTATLAFFDQSLRRQLSTLGMPPGRKSRTVTPPPLAGHLEVPYLRGLLDGDGSVGFTARDRPFVSFVSDSEPMVRFVEAQIFRHTGLRRRAGRNARDGAFNVMVMALGARDLAAAVWCGEGDLGIRRKRDAAFRAAAWSPPVGAESRFGVRVKAWSAEQDHIAMTLEPDVAAIRLGRTVQSIKMRRWRLAKAATGPVA